VRWHYVTDAKRVTTAPGPWPTEMHVTTSLIVDDHPIVLRACSALMLREGFSNVLTATRVLDGFRLYRAARPNVVITDLAFAREFAGLALVRRLRRIDSQLPILVLSMHTAPLVVARAIAFGATGYITKSASTETFVRAIHAVRSGHRYICPDLARDVVFLEADQVRDPLRRLSSRERRIFDLIVSGKSYRDVATDLQVSYKTVSNTSSLIKLKLGVTNLAEMIVLDIKHRTPVKANPDVIDFML